MAASKEADACWGRDDKRGDLVESGPTRFVHEKAGAEQGKDLPVNMQKQSHRRRQILQVSASDNFGDSQRETLSRLALDLNDFLN